MKTFWSYLTFLVLITSSAKAQDTYSIISANRLSPHLRQLMQFSDKTQLSDAAGVNASQEMEFVLRCDDPNEIKKHGIAVRSVQGDIVTVEMSLQQLPNLADCPSVKYIQESMTERPFASSFVHTAHVKDVHCGIFNNMPIKGDNVLLAIYDSGIDWSSPDFSRADDTSKTRILYLWDQTGYQDSIHKAPSGFTYGVEYSSDAINRAIKGNHSEYIQQRDQTRHGSTVAAIAAGNGRQTTSSSGIAPNADLIIIKGGDGSYSEAKIIDALTYIDQIANALGRPVVLNVSLGSQNGAHDGSSLCEKAIDAFASKPGRAVVVAAGNDGQSPIHAEAMLSAYNDSASIPFTVPSFDHSLVAFKDLVNFDIWYQSSDSIEVSLVKDSGERWGAVTHEPAVYTESPQGGVYIDNASAGESTLSNMNCASIQLFNRGRSNPSTGAWRIVIRNEGKSATSQVHIWITESHLGAKQVMFDSSSPNVTDRVLIASPGNSSGAITVGAFQANDPTGKPSNFSSPGPRIDEMQKPEVLAADEGNMSVGIANSILSPSGSFTSVSGTSFAAPQVAGVVALLFQTNPLLTTREIKEIIRKSSTVDPALAKVSVNKRGFGRVDGLNALRIALNIYLTPPSSRNAEQWTPVN
jgi:minor extracellular serine protease Vpr